MNIWKDIIVNFKIFLYTFGIMQSQIFQNSSSAEFHSYIASTHISNILPSAFLPLPNVQRKRKKKFQKPIISFFSVKLICSEKKKWNVTKWKISEEPKIFLQQPKKCWKAKWKIEVETRQTGLFMLSIVICDNKENVKKILQNVVIKIIMGYYYIIYHCCKRV